MKLICLNLWGGKLYESLMRFLEAHAGDTDIFCFQEVFDSTELRPLPSGGRSNLFSEVEKVLSKHQGYFTSAERGHDFKEPVSFPLSLGNAVFVHKSFSMLDYGAITVANTASGKVESKFRRPRQMQYMRVVVNGESVFTVGNLHGLLDDGAKRDTPARLAQFTTVKGFFDQATGKKILCGDFNVYPDTQSIRVFENGMRNLIREYGITATRNSLYPGMEKFRDYISDYMFVSPDVRVADFRVITDTVSDHLPLLLEFD